MTKNILVTGGAGYIGAHNCKALYQAGFNPITFDNLSHGHKKHVKWGPFEYGDLLNLEKIREVIKKYKPVAVMHFAAFSLVGESVSDPFKYYQNNVYGSANLLKAMVLEGVDKIIFSSTCAIYGNPENLPINEETAKNPINPYGRSKLMIEDMLKDFEMSNNIKHVCLRYFNVCGASKDGEIGELHEPETHLVPLVIDAALGKRKNITIYGDDYKTRDGTCIRDYIYIEDLADAHIKSLQYLIAGNQSNYFNVGIGKGFSVKEVIDAVKEISQKDFEVIIGPRRDGDPETLFADNKKISQTLGWKAKSLDIKEMIATAYGWHQSL